MAFDPRVRNALVAEYRRRVYERNHLTPFYHQAEWQLASEGWTLEDRPPLSGEHFAWVLQPNPANPDDPAQALRVRKAISPRAGGVARVCADMASYKGGKSYGTGMWLTGFAAIPGAQVVLLGLEYSTSDPEFTYLEEFLLSERGMNERADVHQHDVEHGRMRITLRNGCTFKVASYMRKEGLKGKKITAYVFTEAYQLPGLHVYTSIKQNLRELQGFAVFPTTPDSAWVSKLHDMGHADSPDHDPEWHCTCGIDASANPFSFSLKEMVKDAPSWDMIPTRIRQMAEHLGYRPEGLMTREKFAISWLGKLGHYVGSCYDFQRGQLQFTPTSHPLIYAKHIREGASA